MILAAAPALLLVPALLLLPEPKRGASEICPAPLVPSSTWTVLRIPTMWWIIASGALLNFNMYAVATFLPAFLSRIHKLTLAHSGIATGIVFAVGGVAGGLLAGRVGDFIIGRRKDGRLLCAAVGAVCGMPFAYFGILSTGPYLAILWMTIAYGSLTSYYGLVYSAIHDIVAPSSDGTALAVYFM